MLSTKPFDYYEYDSFNKTDEEIIEELQKAFKRFNQSFDLYGLDLNNFEVLMGLVGQFMDWRSYTELDIKYRMHELMSELIRRKIEKIRK